MDHSEITSSIHKIRIQPDFSSVHSAIEESTNRLLKAFEEGKWQEQHSLLEAVQGRESKQSSAEVLAAIRRIRSDDNQILDTLQSLRTSLLDSIRGMRVDLMPVLDTLSTNHRQLLEVRPHESSDQAELLRAVRGLQAQRDLVSMIQRTVEDNHRNVVDVVKSAKVDVLNALGSMEPKTGDSHIRAEHVHILDALGNIDRQAQRMGENVESNHQHLLSISEALHLHPNAFHERLDDHNRNMLSAIEAGMNRMDRDGRSEHAELTYETTVLERIAASNQDVIAAVQTAKSEHFEVLSALHRLVSEVHEKPDVSELRQAIHTSSNEAVQKIVAVIENAVDHSPLLEAIGSFELKGHSDVLAALRQLQIDLHMEPDFSPVLRAISELEGAFEKIQAGFAPQASERSASPASRRKYIVTLGGENGVPTSVRETEFAPVLNAISQLPGIQKIQGMCAPYTWTSMERPATPTRMTWNPAERQMSPPRRIWPVIERQGQTSPMSYPMMN